MIMRVSPIGEENSQSEFRNPKQSQNTILQFTQTFNAAGSGSLRSDPLLGRKKDFSLRSK
jgi:hypothetical protein